MKINKNNLLSVLEKVAPGADERENMLEGTDSFAFTKGGVHSYNDYISISSPFVFEGGEVEGSVKAKDFLKILKKFPDDEIEGEVKGDRWCLVSGNLKVNINFVKSDTLPYLKDILANDKDFIDVDESFQRGLTLCYINNNAHKYRGVACSGDKFYSTDGMRVNIYELAENLPPFYIDEEGIKQIIKIPKIKSLHIGEGWAHFKDGDGVVFSCRVKNYKDFGLGGVQAIEEKNRYMDGDIMVDLPAAFPEMVERASILALDMTGRDALKMTLEDKFLSLYGERVSGDIHEKIEIDAKIDKPVTVYLGSDFLKEVVKKTNSLYLKFDTDKGMYLTVGFENEAKTYRQLVAVMRLPKEAGR